MQIKTQPHPLQSKTGLQLIHQDLKNKLIFQKYISKAKLNSKFTPKIKFFLDDSFDEAKKIEKLLLNKNVARDLDE